MSEPAVRYQCRHIQPSGHRCGSPALRSESFCYYHHSSRRAKPTSLTPQTFVLPALDDRTTLQQAIGDVLARIAGGTLDLKRAGLLLYGLQIASGNLPPHKLTLPALSTVEEITLDEHNEPLAPEQQFQSPAHEKTLYECLQEKWDQDAQLRAADDAIAHPDLYRKASADRPSEPGSLPSLEAAAVKTSNMAGTKKREGDPVRTERSCSGHFQPPSDAAKPLLLGGGFCGEDVCRRSPNLPHTYACSTIGPTRLNFRVRDGNGCDPRGKLTGK